MARPIPRHGAASSVYRFESEVPLVELFQRTHPQQGAVLANAEERHIVGEQSVHVEGMHILWRTVLVGECQMWF